MPTSLYRRCCAIMALVLAGIVSTANPAIPTDGPADYSYRLPLRVVSSQAVVQLPLPRAVYLNARSSALHDLRVFDAAGASMPSHWSIKRHPLSRRKPLHQSPFFHCTARPGTQGRCPKACRSAPAAMAPSFR